MLKSSAQKPHEAIRAELAGRLRVRRPEVERVVLARIRRLADPLAGGDPGYVASLQGAIAAGIGYGVECLDKGAEQPVPIPSETARQARRAARAGVGLDILLRSYAAGNKALEEFVVAVSDGVSGRNLSRMLGDQGPRFDRLLESVTEEYEDELERMRRSPSQREADRIVHLVQNDGAVGPADIDYDFDAWHVGMILRGRGGRPVARALAGGLGHRLLCAERSPELTWAWLGSRRPPAHPELRRCLEGTPVEISIAAGEPRSGLGGWRLTHREAQVALEAMRLKPQRLICGRNVVLRVGVMRDETLVRSLVDTYLTPLEAHANAQKMIEALRAYFCVGGNAASAAALLGVTRHTVQRRIRAVEQALGQPFYSCYAELQVALQVADLLPGFADG